MTTQNQKNRNDITKHTAEFLSKGHRITHLGFCVPDAELEPFREETRKNAKNVKKRNPRDISITNK